MALIKKTTKEHYEKYAAMVKNNHIDLTNSNVFPPKERLIELFKDDTNLNNIPLRVFDSLFFSLRIYQLQNLRQFGPCSLAENTSMYKHALIYQVIGAIPEFKE